MKKRNLWPLFLFFISGFLAFMSRASPPKKLYRNSRLAGSINKKNLSDDRTRLSKWTISLRRITGTDEDNNENPLQKIREFCGFRQFSHAKGYTIFSQSIYDPMFNNHSDQSTIGFLKKEALCICSLASKIRDISDKLTELHIVLPSVNTEFSAELNSVTDIYFSALGDIFEIKSKFNRVTISSFEVLEKGNVSNSVNFGDEYLHQDVERKILYQLATLKIDFLDIRFKLRNAHLFINSSIKKLRATQHFFNSNYSTFPLLSSIVFSESHFSHEKQALARNPREILRIAKSVNVKELTLPSNLIPEVLRGTYFVENLFIFGSTGMDPGIEYLKALQETNQGLKQLKFGEYLNPPIKVLSTILDIFKPSLTSFALHFQKNNRTENYARLLSTFLRDNKQLDALEVSVDDVSSFTHTFLRDAKKLNSYSFKGKTGEHILSLLSFIAFHDTLQSLSLEFTYDEKFTEAAFLDFCRKLFIAIRTNSAIERVTLLVDVDVLDPGASVKVFIRELRCLVTSSRKLTLNSVPVDVIVSDLADGLKDGLLWAARINNTKQILSLG